MVFCACSLYTHYDRLKHCKKKINTKVGWALSAGRLGRQGRPVAGWRVLREEDALVCDAIEFHADYEGVVSVAGIPCKKGVSLVIRIVN